MSTNKKLPDFSGVVFLPAGKRSQASNPPEKTDLFKFFNAIIKSKKLEIDDQQLEHMFCQDLTINTKKLNKRLVGVLGEALIYYITIWPGWERSNEYYRGELPCKEWYERFRQYLIFKSNYIIKNEPQLIESVSTCTKEVEVQTEGNKDSGAKKKIASYTLCVGGPPSVLNNIVFMESDGNILIKQHMEKQWHTLEMKEFLNWPHVAVEIKLPDISFSRTNAHAFERYIALCGDVTVFPEVNNINYIKKTPDAVEHEVKPYDYDFIACYLQQLRQTLEKVPDVNVERLQELDAIFAEFLADIKEVNVYDCTMSTYVSIGYHIGKGKYIRNKKMVSSGSDKKDQNAINFYEILIPQVDFSLNYFKALQDCLDKINVSFQSLNRLNKLLISDSGQPEIEKLRFLVNNTCIAYYCTLCTEKYSGPHAKASITKHFLENHKAEQAVLCFKCRKQFDVQLLARQRWMHKCS